MCFIFYVTFLQFSYECNLRAYLMRRTFDQPIDSARDILTLNRRLYLPYGTPFIKMFATSPIPVHRESHQYTCIEYTIIN